MNAYHYTECGLPNVFIDGLSPVIDAEGDEVITIPFIAALHAEITRGIVTHDGAMTGQELRFVRSELGMTQADLASVLGTAALTVGRWERGEHPMDKSAETLVRKFAVERLLKPFDAGIEELAQKVAQETREEKQINIRARDGGYDLAA